MAQSIVLHDGSAYPVSWCGESDGYLYAGLTEEHDVLKVAKVFHDPEKTQEIVYLSSKHFTGYTDLISVVKDPFANTITVCLKKTAGENLYVDSLQSESGA